MPYTRVFDEYVVCDDCGAFATREEDVVHHEGCRPGESEYWRRYYDEADQGEPASTDQPDLCQETPDGRGDRLSGNHGRTSL